MTGNIVISAIIVLAIVAIMAGTGNPLQSVRRKRLQEEQMTSEKPFQMGNDSMTREQLQQINMEDR